MLFVVPYAPTRIRTRPFHLVRALAAEGHQVTVATVWRGREEQAALEDLASGGTKVVAERLPVGRSLWNCLRALTGTDPLQAHFSWSPRLARRLAALIQLCRVDVVHVEHMRGVRYGLLLGETTRPAEARPAMVWDSVDCISSLFRRAARESETRRARLAARLELPRTERYEGRVATRFDRVLVTSSSDRHELLELAEPGLREALSARVDVLPNGVDLDYFSPPSEPREPRTLVITGKMSYHANTTAVVRFVGEVMPAVWSSCPDVRLLIVGKDPPREVAKLAQDQARIGPSGRANRVVVTGTVSDLRPYLRRATLAIAPIHYGVGIQNKVLEAFACGTTVIATHQAVSALDVTSGEQLMIASGPSDLARTIVSLLANPERCARLGEAGRAFVERRHNWRELAARLAALYFDARN